jgi:integrase/recombinase XerD
MTPKINHLFLNNLKTIVMASIKAILNTSYQTVDGKYQIVIRVSHMKKRKYYDVGVQVKEENFNEEEQRVMDTKTSKVKDKDLINAKLQDMLATANKYEAACSLNNRIFDVNAVFAQRVDNGNFTQFIKTLSSHYLQNDQIGGYETAEHIIANLTKWKGGDVFLSDLSIDKCRQLDMYIKNELGNSQNTRFQKFSILIGYYNKAMAQMNAPAPNPFEQYKELYKLKKEPTKKEILTQDELLKIINADGLTRKQMLVRDKWLFSYFCRGIRYQNILLVKKSDIRDDRVYWRAVKGKKYASQIIHPRLRTIINKYLKTPGEYLFFPEMPPKDPTGVYHFVKKHNKTDNNTLERILEKLGITKEITFHSARRTFANHFREKTDKVSAIQDAMTHTESRTTEGYLVDFEEQFLDKELEKLYGSPLHVVKDAV